MDNNDEIIEQLREALANNDTETAEKIVEDNEDDYDGDLKEEAFRIAVQEECIEYVDNHTDDVDLNDCGDCSSYLDETENEDIIDLLISAGAFRSWDEYADNCRFAAETVNNSVLAFDPEFQKEVFEKFLEVLGISEEELAELLENGEAEDYELPEALQNAADSLEEACEMLKVTAEDGEITLEEFDSMDNSVDGMALHVLIEALGWECSFEGDNWTLETNGVVFIK